MPKSNPLELNLRILTRIAPAVHTNRPTLFGLQEKGKIELHQGEELDRLLAFDTRIRIKNADGVARFFGPQVHGAGDKKHLYITWRFADGDQEIINRLKVALSIPWALVEESLRLNMPLITDGSAPEWGILKDWHGLGLGEHWTIDNTTALPII